MKVLCHILHISGKPDCDCMGMKKWRTPRWKGTLTKHLGPFGRWSLWWRVNCRFSAFITYSTRKRVYPVSLVDFCRGAINIQEKGAVLDVFCTQCQHLYRPGEGISIILNQIRGFLMGLEHQGLWNDHAYTKQCTLTQDFNHFP